MPETKRCGALNSDGKTVCRRQTRNVRCPAHPDKPIAGVIIDAKENNEKPTIAEDINTILLRDVDILASNESEEPNWLRRLWAKIRRNKQ